MNKRKLETTASNLEAKTFVIYLLASKQEARVLINLPSKITII